MKITEQDALRFESKIAKSEGCWLWTGGTISKVPGRDYGRFVAGGKKLLAHRVSYQIANGRLPKRKEICHSCDCPRCVNPGHLFAGTHLVNMRDMFAKGRREHACGDRNGARTMPERHARGTRHPRHRLSEGQVLRIRELDGRIAHAEIARHYNVSDGCVQGILKRRTWRHL